MVQRSLALFSRRLFQPMDVGRYADNCILLGLRTDATTKDIKHAYFTLSKRLHPNLCGDLAHKQFQTVYEAYNELMYSNIPLQFGNFPEVTSSCRSYLQHHISFEEAFVEACIEYDADLKEFRELEAAFKQFIINKRDTRPPEYHMRDLKQLDRYQKKFAFLHHRFDALHDRLTAIQHDENYPNCSLKTITSFADPKRKFWNAQNAYLHAQKDLLAYMEHAKEQEKVAIFQN